MYFGRGIYLDRGKYLDRGACIEKIINRGPRAPSVCFTKLQRESSTEIRSESDVSIGTLKQPKHPEATQPRHDGVGPKR